MDFGVVTENDSTMVIDHNKVKRAQTEVIGMVTESKDDELKKNGLDNLLFDGRIDKTKVWFEVENSITQYHGLIKEEH